MKTGHTVSKLVTGRLIFCKFTEFRELNLLCVSSVNLLFNQVSFQVLLMFLYAAVLLKVWGVLRKVQ